MNKDIVLLDLFSGIGGFAKGLSDAGFNITTHYFSEIDRHAIAVYKYQFKHSNYVGSVTTVDGSTITRPNIITFGSPCQDFSVAGKRAGMEGQRSSLIGQALRLIAECRPDVFIWENVKGVFSSNNSEDFWAIIQAFANIGGYRLEWQLLNTAWFLPQNRERIYLIGHLGAGSGRLIFPFREGDAVPYISDGQAQPSVIVDTNYLERDCRVYDKDAPTLSARAYKDPKICVTLTRHRSDQEYKQGDIAPTVRNSDKAEVRIIAQRGRGEDNTQQLEPRKDTITNTLTGVQKDNMIQVFDYRSDEGIRIRDDGNSPTLNARARTDKYGQPMIALPKQKGRTKNCNGKTPRVNTKMIRNDNDKECPTLTACGLSKNANDQPWINTTSSNIRRLTEVECERLQGFPDNWTRYGNYDGTIKEVCKSQRYKMCGNAVTVKVVEELGKRLLKC